jgi:hypothetical protein
MNEIQVGSRVERIASDYTGGRRGEVIELDPVKPRARVQWALQGRNLRTWVRLADLKIV